MGIDYTTIAAYGVIFDREEWRKVNVDDRAIYEAGFEIMHADCYADYSSTFIYIPKTRIRLDYDSYSRAKIREIAQPYEEEKEKTSEGTEKNENEEKGGNGAKEEDDEEEEEDEDEYDDEDNTQSRKRRRVGAVIEIPCPSKAECDNLIMILKQQRLIAADASVKVKPRYFHSVC